MLDVDIREWISSEASPRPGRPEALISTGGTFVLLSRAAQTLLT